MTNAEEKIWIIALKSGDHKAFDQLFKIYAPRLGYFCLQWVEEEDAKEVVQDTFLRLWETRERIDVERNLNTYITSIAKNLIYDLFRKRTVEQRYVQDLQPFLKDHWDAETELHTENLREVLTISINKLSGQQREVMLLKSKGYANEEIAELLQISKRTVEAHVGKAYKHLRDELGELRHLSFFFPFLLNM